MSLRSWWIKRSREKRRRKAAQDNSKEPLREFVYLDEVSVFSLLSSRIGALATHFTESESTSLSSEIKGNFGASAPIIKANVTSSIKSGEYSGTQVMRKSTVQSTFKDLLGYVHDTLALRPPLQDEGEAPSVGAFEDILEQANNASSRWAVDPGKLERGLLLEIEVELHADVNFRASAVLSTILDFVDSMPQLRHTMEQEDFLSVETGTRLIEKLLVGLVPVQGKAIDYSHIDFDGREIIVHKKLLDQLPTLAKTARPLFIVGVAEEALFWRDIRRILFSGSRYRMLCRVGRSGAQRDWTPVKLMDVLAGAIPPLRDAVEQIPELLDKMTGDDEEVEDDAERQMRTALNIYALDICADNGHPLTADDLADRGLPTREQVSAFKSVEARRAAFAELTEALDLDIALTPERLAAYRSNALVEAGVLTSAVVPRVEPDAAAEAVGFDARYLDCEIIAIYW